MLEERYKELGYKRDYILRGFGKSGGTPGFWCRKGEWNGPIECIRDCKDHLGCEAKFKHLHAEDRLDDDRYDWTLMVLSGRIRPPFCELGLPIPT